MRFLTLAAAAAFFMPAAATAAPLCLAHADMLSLSAQRFQERRVAVALTDGGRVLEVLASKDGRTWTIIITDPNGRSCPVSAGEAWQAITPEEPEA